MRQEKISTDYILASCRHGTFYCGVTSDLCSRISLQKARLLSGFFEKVQHQDAGVVSGISHDG
jgi:predicted GIY-YIG superfamily endonuclease